MYANYRATCRARSRAEFIAKIGLVAEESDESLGWLELISALDLSNSPELTWLRSEANELLAIFAASQKTARENSALRKIDNHPIDNRRLPERFHNLFERLFTRAHSLQGQRRQRLVDDVQLRRGNRRDRARCR